MTTEPGGPLRYFRCLTILVAAALVLTACASGADSSPPAEEPGFETSEGPFILRRQGPAIYAQSTQNGYDDGETGGTLELVDGCLYAGGSPIVWPPLTSWQADPPAVVLADGGVIEVGTRFRSGGGSNPVSSSGEMFGETASEWFEACTDELGSVVVIAPGIEVINLPIARGIEGGQQIEFNGVVYDDTGRSIRRNRLGEVIATFEEGDQFQDLELTVINGVDPTVAFVRVGGGRTIYEQAARIGTVGPVVVAMNHPGMDDSSVLEGGPGVLTLDANNCLLVGGLPVLWPFGTSWDSETSSLIVPDGTKVSIGEMVSIGGASTELARVEAFFDDQAQMIAADCDWQSNEIFSAGTAKST